MDAHTTYRQRDQLIVLDVRQPHEWRTGRVDFARHIPLTQLPRRLRELDRHTPIAAGSTTKPPGTGCWSTPPHPNSTSLSVTRKAS